jgi:hypothetical protein
MLNIDADIYRSTEKRTLREPERAFVANSPGAGWRPRTWKAPSVLMAALPQAQRRSSALPKANNRWPFRSCQGGTM